MNTMWAPCWKRKAIILILKIRKSKSVGGNIDSRHRGDQLSRHRWSTLFILGEGIDNWCREDQQSTFTFTWKGDHLCWSWGWGQVDNRHREDQQSTFTFMWKGNCLCCVDPGGGEELMPPRHSVRSTGWPLVIIYNWNVSLPN